MPFKDSEKRREYNRVYWKANAAGLREQKKTYRKANAEKIREHDRAQYAANPEKRREQNNAWAKAHPEGIRERATARYYANPEEAESHGNVARHTLDRLDSFVDAVVGKRITYSELTA
jgi:hypothetical protein